MVIQFDILCDILLKLRKLKKKIKQNMMPMFNRVVLLKCRPLIFCIKLNVRIVPCIIDSIMSTPIFN